MVKTERKKATNFQNWKITQRHIRIEHNKAVVNWFRNTNTTARSNLKNSLLIYKKDTASQILVKMQFFANYLDNKTQFFNTFPEDYQVKVQVDRPQLVIVFQPTKKGKTNKQYPIHLPHYVGGRVPPIKKYYKGNFWARVILKDNSNIIINGRTKTEAVSVVKNFLRLVDTKYRVSSDKIVTGEYFGRPFEVLEMKPRRADFYSKGKLQSYPDWQYYFK